MAALPERAWFEEWFDRDYLLVYGHRDARDARKGAELLEKSVRPAPGAHVLDLACGPGRHAVELVERGHRVVGLDLSPTLLAEARRVLGGRAALVRADMRDLPLRDRSFDLVASFFTSFGYFDEAGNRRVLGEIARVLRPGGALFLDYANRDVVLARLQPEGKKSLGSTFVLESRRYDAESGRLVKEIEIQEGSETRRRRESVRLYAPQEITALLGGAGLAVEARFGDLEGVPFDAQVSPRLVVVARRQG